MKTSAVDRLIIALDTPSLAHAKELIVQTRCYASTYKIGMELFVAEGLKAVQMVLNEQVDVFLDLKLHDIPRTMAATTRELSKLGVRFFTLHALAGASALKEVAKVLSEQKTTTALAVSMLTHHTEEECAALGFHMKLENQVKQLLEMARESGIRGGVCSPREVRLMRAALGSDFTIVCPGIRSAGAAPDDQTRTLDAKQAILAGADYLVVGRPIVRADDPLAAAAAIHDEIAKGLIGKDVNR
jgi:orotidine-5'-phosphate decarboxylase